MIYFLYHEVPQKKAYEFQPLASSGTHYLNIDKLIDSDLSICLLLKNMSTVMMSVCQLMKNLSSFLIPVLSVYFWNFCEFITIFFKVISIYRKSLSRSCINCSVIVWKKSIVWNWFGLAQLIFWINISLRP